MLICEDGNIMLCFQEDPLPSHVCQDEKTWSSGKARSAATCLLPRSELRVAPVSL